MTSSERRWRRQVMRSALARALLQLCALLPLRAAHALGAGLGRLAARLPNKTRSVTLANVRRCFPDMPEQKRARLARHSLIETGRALTECGPLWLWHGLRVLGLVRRVSGEQQVIDALRRGKGLILVSPHLGAWEMVGLYCSSRWPLTSLYRTPRLAGLDGPVRAARERLGAQLVANNTAGVRALYQALSRGEAVGILPDQDPGSGVFAPFFNVPANTMVLLPRLARKTGAAVVFVYAERLAHGAGYHIHFRTAPPGIAAEDPQRAAASLNQGVEECVRALPEQYLWSYKRFRTRPAGENGFY